MLGVSHSADTYRAQRVHTRPHNNNHNQSYHHQQQQQPEQPERRVHFEDDGVWPLLLSRDTINNRLGHKNLSRKETLNDTYLPVTPAGAASRRAKAAANSHAIRLLKRRRGGRKMIDKALDVLETRCVTEKSELEVCVTPDLRLDRHRRTTRKSPRWVAASE